MRKLERQMNFAVSNKANWAGSNTQVNYNSNTNCSSIYLHGHQIATVDHNLRAVKLSSWLSNSDHKIKTKCTLRGSKIRLQSIPKTV